MDIGICFYDGYENMSCREQLETIKNCGFTHIFPDTFSPVYDEVCQTAPQYGITIDFCHAHFRGINAMWAEGEEGDVFEALLTEDIDKCARYAVPGVIIHLSSGENPPRINETGYRRFGHLVAHAKEKGVTVFFENLRTVANLAWALEVFPEAGFCWDVGHEAVFADGKQYMPMFGNRLGALHLHDNFGIHNKDEHMLPYDGSLDYERIARQIAESPFTGTVMLEVLRNNNHTYDGMSNQAYLKRAADSARRLSNRIQAIRQQA